MSGDVGKAMPFRKLTAKEKKLANKRFKELQKIEEQAADRLAWVQKLEAANLADVSIQDLRMYLEALGGELELVIKFPKAK